MINNMRVLEPKSTEVTMKQRDQESHDLSCVRCTTAQMGVRYHERHYHRCCDFLKW